MHHIVNTFFLSAGELFGDFLKPVSGGNLQFGMEEGGKTDYNKRKFLKETNP